LDAMFAAGSGFPASFMADPAHELTIKRLRLPAKASGAGFRDLADTAPAAFLGAAWQILHLLIPRAAGASVVRGPGYYKPFEQLLGVGSFDDSFAGSRYGFLLANPCPLSTAMVAAWLKCRQGIPAADLAVAGPLHGLVQDSGASYTKRGQHHLTKFREKVRGKELRVRMGALGRMDPIKMAYFSVSGSPTATVVYTSWPRSGFQFSRVEWHELTHIYAGQPSPLLSPHVGSPIAGIPGTIVDSMGMNLVSSIRLPGDGLRKRHDQVKWSLVESLRAMGMAVRPEVYGIFSAVNSAAANHHMHANNRERQGLVPDLMWRDGDGDRRLGELKSISLSPSHYKTNILAQHVHNAYAVKRRAASIPGTYVRKARRVDQRFNGTAVNAVGPMEQRLKDFGDPCVTPLVFGWWGEINSEFDDLLKYAASVGASRLWQPMLAASPEKAQGILLWNLRRRIGCEALRANVQHLMDRSAFITGDAAAAAARRDRAMSTYFQGGDPGSVGQAYAMSRLNHGPRGDGAW
jgi:hypothetical protein